MICLTPTAWTICSLGTPALMRWVSSTQTVPSSSGDGDGVVPVTFGLVAGSVSGEGTSAVGVGPLSMSSSSSPGEGSMGDTKGSGVGLRERLGLRDGSTVGVIVGGVSVGIGGRTMDGTGVSDSTGGVGSTGVSPGMETTGVSTGASEGEGLGGMGEGGMVGVTEGLRPGVSDGVGEARGEATARSATEISQILLQVHGSVVLEESTALQEIGSK